MKFTLITATLLSSALPILAGNSGQSHPKVVADDMDKTSHVSHKAPSSEDGVPEKMCDKEKFMDAQMSLLFEKCNLRDSISAVVSIFENGFAYNQQTQQASTDPKQHMDDILANICKKKDCYDSMQGNMYALNHNCGSEDPQFVKEQTDMANFISQVRHSALCKRNGAHYCGSEFVMRTFDYETAYIRHANGSISDDQLKLEKNKLCDSCWADVFGYLKKRTIELGYKIEDTLQPLAGFKTKPLDITPDVFAEWCPSVTTDYVNEDEDL